MTSTCGSFWDVHVKMTFETNEKSKITFVATIISNKTSPAVRKVHKGVSTVCSHSSCSVTQQLCNQIITQVHEAKDKPGQTEGGGSWRQHTSCVGLYVAVILSCTGWSVCFQGEPSDAKLRAGLFGQVVQTLVAIETLECTDGDLNKTLNEIQ